MKRAQNYTIENFNPSHKNIQILIENTRLLTRWQHISLQIAALSLTPPSQ